MTPQNQPEPQSDELEKLITDYAYEIYITKDLPNDEQDKEQLRLLGIYKAAFEAWGTKQQINILEGLPKQPHSVHATKTYTCVSTQAINHVVVELQRGKND